MCDFDLSPVDTLDKTSAEAMSDQQESTIYDDSSTDDGVSHVNDIIEGTDGVQTKEAKDLEPEAHPNNQLIVTIFDTCVANNANASEKEPFVEKEPDGENEATTASKNKYISFKGMTFKVGKIFRCCYFK